ncbi:hypothetical protein CRENBAI_019531 [Crenichthys baileyi]|uniref:TIR domain-containing protein n=1 Tax=Crenichthys baileyi TaxID=28760 RepID=A0AAV9QZJ1_9TELE
MRRISWSSWLLPLREAVADDAKMARAALLLLLLNISACSGFGFRSCSQNYAEADYIWCFNRMIDNISGVVNMLPENITAINLSKNMIRAIPPGAFARFARLKHLDLSQNKLFNLKGEEFKSLHLMVFLNLSCNNISNIHSNTFEGLTSLKVLLLSQNYLSGVFGLLFNLLPAIEVVDLSLNRLRSFSCEECGGSLTLKYLNLSVNNIQKVNVSCFPALMYIQLSNNTELELRPDTFDSNQQLSTLLLQSVKVEGLMGLSGQTKRDLIHVSFSIFAEKSPWMICDVLRGMDNVSKVEVDLKGSKLPASNTSLLDCPTPTTLHRLSLMKNEITELEPNVFHALTQLEQLYLQFNLLKSLKKKTFGNLYRLKKLNLSLNLICFIEEGTFQDLKNLRYLDLSGNRISRVTPSILSGLKKLTHIILYNNRLHFRSYEAPFIHLTSLEYLEMRYQGPGGYGIGDIGPDFFKGLQKLKCMQIGNSIKMNVHPGAFAPLISLKILYIYGVNLKEINLTAVLLPLKGLSKLMLNRADLDTLPAHLLPPNNSLEVLRVESNHIHTLSKEILDNLPRGVIDTESPDGTPYRTTPRDAKVIRLRVFDISENQLSCTCDNAWFKTWAINNTQIQVPYLYNLECDNGKSRYLWQFDDKACSYDQISLTLFISCTVMDVLFVFVCLTWHIQGPTLRFLLLMVKARLRGRKRGAGAKFQYDAFISYSSKDEDWVMGQLVPNLERPDAGALRLRLCLHHRDFRPGAAVLENIEAAIYSSRHTICVVTRSYLQSEWCSVEFQLASLRLLCDGSDVLLLVFLEEIPEHCPSPYARLRRIVHRKTYLLWPENPEEQDAFWVRLKDALKDSKDLEEEEEVDVGGEQWLAPLIG